MSFGDLKSAAGLAKLNSYLAGRSYIEGYVPSTADTAVADLVSSAPDAKKYPHAARWFRHVSSFDAGARKGFAKAGKDYAAAAGAADDEEEDVDLFGSDDDEGEGDAEAQRVREERLKAYEAKKSKKPTVIAKTSVLLDVKPWDDETDMNAMLKAVKEIEMEGLVWGASKLVPVGYGIQKLQVMCTVEDAKVSIDELQEKIQDLEDFVQSCDVAAMNKI